MGETMRAAVVKSLDGVEAIEIQERPLPTLQPGFVRVRVGAAGVNFADVLQARGLYGDGPRAPYVAGIEAAGVVAQAEPDTGFAPGDRVMGYGAFAFAEQVDWPAGNLLNMPDDWSFERGAAFPVQWLTAHGCLRVVGRLQRGESVLIHAAAGGVGSAAVTLAKHYGAKVYATASSDEKLALAAKLGADELINYSTCDFSEEIKKRTAGKGVDLILESVGGRTFELNFRAVRPYGRIVVFGSASAKQAVVDNNTLVYKPVEVCGYHLAAMARKRPDLMMPALAEVMQLIKRGVVCPPEPRSYPLGEASRALADLEGRRTTGKLVLIP